MKDPGIANSESPPVTVPCSVIWTRPVTIPAKSSADTGSDTTVPVIRSQVVSPGRFTSNRTASVFGEVSP